MLTPVAILCYTNCIGDRDNEIHTTIYKVRL
jgi:hypothetical protein